MANLATPWALVKLVAFTDLNVALTTKHRTPWQAAFGAIAIRQLAALVTAGEMIRTDLCLNL